MSADKTINKCKQRVSNMMACFFFGGGVSFWEVGEGVLFVGPCSLLQFINYPLGGAPQRYTPNACERSQSTGRAWGWWQAARDLCFPDFPESFFGKRCDEHRRMNPDRYTLR